MVDLIAALSGGHGSEVTGTFMPAAAQSFPQIDADGGFRMVTQDSEA